jgi:phosphatidylcholine synthase
MGREKLLRLCAWGVHLYTASGAIAGLFSFERTARGDFRGAFMLMALAVLIDSSDGPLARMLEVRERIPEFDGALLDNVVDYLNYVAVPVFLILRAELIPGGYAGVALGGFVMLASAYGFCRLDAKTEDHYFRGFPSYWNVVALYLYCLGLSPCANAIVIVALGVMVFVPIKYIYPNRTEPLRRLTLALAIVWAVATAAMIPALPAPAPVLLYTSLGFVVYYVVMSFVLQAYRVAIARRVVG